MAGSSFAMVGFGTGLLAGLDAVLPPGSLVIVEDPDIAEVRDVRRRMAAFSCVAGLVEAPVQDEDRAADLVTGWELPDLAAVIPGVEYGVVAAAALADHRGLPGAGLAAARLLRDKVELRAAADSAGLAQPRWREAWSAADVRDFGAGPCVLKPANRQASVGVQLLDAADDRDLAWQRTVDAEEPLMRSRRGPAPRYIVEDRLHGHEVSAEALVSDGQIIFLNVTDKTVLPGRYPVELGHLVRAPASPGVSAAMRALVAATGFGSGTLHAEWMLSGGAPYLIECAGRMPGDEIVPLIDLAYGGSLAGDFVAVLSGRRPARPAAPAGGAAVRFLTASPGLVTGIEGAGAARAVPGVTDVRVSVVPGDTIGVLRSSWDRAGRVIAAAPTPGQASRAAADAVGAITIHTRPDAPALVSDPRMAGDWWPKQPADPRDGLSWACGVSDPVSFLGFAQGPALWLRDPGGSAGRMDPIRVLSGDAAGLDAGPRPRAAAGACPRLVVSAATGYGSPMVSRADPVPGDVAALVAALTSHARERDATPVVLHCPGGDPLLPALAAQGYAIGVTDLYPVLDLPGTAMEDYLSSLSRGRRSTVRQEVRARDAGTASTYVGEDARPHLAEAARLSASAYRQRGQPGDDARALPIYGRLLDSCGADFVLTMVADEEGPVASACLIAGETDLLLYSAGLELPRSRAVAGYFNAAYYLPAEFAYQRGLTRILLGPTGWHAKRLRGARFTPLCSAVPAAATGLASLLAGTDRRLRCALEDLGG
jgi:biotin carboxylase